MAIGYAGIAIRRPGFVFNGVNTLWPGIGLTVGLPAGLTLTPSGGLTTSANGQVIELLEIAAGQIIVNHDDCIVRRCSVVNDTGGTGAVVVNGKRCLVERCYLNGNAALTGGRPIVLEGRDPPTDMPDDSIVQFCECDEGEDGIHIGNGHRMIARYNWIHDLAGAGADPHIDGIQIFGGQEGNPYVDNIIIGNNIDAPPGDNTYSSGFTGNNLERTIIKWNRFNGGAYMCRNEVAMANTQIIENVFTDNHAFGKLDDLGPNSTVSGNLREADGSPVP